MIRRAEINFRLRMIFNGLERENVILPQNDVIR